MSEWISVDERLPEPHYFADMLAWIKCDNKDGGYRDIVSYGEYFFECEDIGPGHPQYVENNDDGNARGFGWHRQEETHGGPYDYIYVDLNDRVTHWMLLPKGPSVQKQPAQSFEEWFEYHPWTTPKSLAWDAWQASAQQSLDLVVPETFHFAVKNEPCTYWSNGSHIVANGNCRCGLAVMVWARMEVQR